MIDSSVSWKKPIRAPSDMLVSSDGQVKRNGRLLKQFPDKHGRLFVRPRVEGKRVRFYVHVLVCEAFHGAKPFPEAHAAHENDIFTDNREDNLSWKTRAENVIDAIRNGRTGKGHNVSKETRNKISASLTGKTQSTETRAKRSASLKGRKMSPEAVAKTAAANLGKKRSEQTRQKLRESHTGKIQSAETKAKRSASLKVWHAKRKELGQL
jgi:HNH endonuclease/NUMOD3 motif